MGKDRNIVYAFDYMYKDKKGSTVTVYSDGTVIVKDFTEELIKRAFGSWGNEAELKDVEELLESRCFPRTRANCKQILKSGDLDFYDPLAICRKTEGRMSDDLFWIRFHDV